MAADRNNAKYWTSLAAVSGGTPEPLVGFKRRRLTFRDAAWLCKRPHFCEEQRVILRTRKLQAELQGCRLHTALLQPSSDCQKAYHPSGSSTRLRVGRHTFAMSPEGTAVRRHLVSQEQAPIKDF
jgi:hypothetical protein